MSERDPEALSEAERERHIVHLTARPIAEDVVWCDDCEEWVMSGEPAATTDAETLAARVREVLGVLDVRATYFEERSMAQYARPLRAIEEDLLAALDPGSSDQSDQGGRA